VTREIPRKLWDELATWEAGAATWIESIPSIVDDIEREWSIEIGPVIDVEATLSWVAAIGEDAVLKVAWPHDEGRDEIAALQQWDGDGAVRVLRHDTERWAYLLERCRPGTKLAKKWSTETVPIGAALLQRLWVPGVGGPYASLGDVLRSWAAIARERAERMPDVLDAGLVAEGCALLESLPGAEQFLLHGDFHPGNVLAAAREPWLAIDPKPLVGDRYWDAVLLVVHGVTDERALSERLALVSDLLSLDRERLRLFCLARVVEWTLWDAAVLTDDGDAVLHAAQARLLAD
jgi:streptomycin 6-kinase